jgi:hypothetical protein
MKLMGKGNLPHRIVRGSSIRKERGVHKEEKTISRAILLDLNSDEGLTRWIRPQALPVKLTLS